MHSVANKTFTYVRNVGGKHGAVLDVVQSCAQKPFTPYLVQVLRVLCAQTRGDSFPACKAMCGSKRCCSVPAAWCSPPHCSLSSPSLFLCISWCRNCWKGIQQGPLLSASSDYPKEKDLTRSSCLPRDLLSRLHNLTAVAIDGVQNNLRQWQKRILEEEFRSY